MSIRQPQEEATRGNPILAGSFGRAPQPPHAAEGFVDHRPKQQQYRIASVVIEPTRPLDQNILMSPPEPIIARRNASSARLPSTSASANGARGRLIFLKTLADTPNNRIARCRTSHSGSRKRRGRPGKTSRHRAGRAERRGPRHPPDRPARDAVAHTEQNGSTPAGIWRADG